MRIALIRLLMATGVIGLMCAHHVRASSSMKAANPLVVVPYDFGDRPAGTIVHFRVPIRNPSQKAVLIKEIQTSCGCTSAKPESWEVRGGGADEVAVRIDSLSVGGSFDGTVLIVGRTAAAPALPILWRIDLGGKFLTSGTHLLAIPRSVHLGYPTPGKSLFQMLHLERNGLVNLGKVTATTSVPWIKVVRDPRRSSGTAAEYRATIRPPLGSGSFQEEIRFQGATPGDFLRVPIFGRTLPVIGIFPNKVLLMPGQHVYPLAVDPAVGGKVTLEGYSVKDRGIKVVSVRESKKEMDGGLVLEVDAKPIGKGFISATLLLRFDQWSKPVRVVFAGIGQ